MSWQESYQAALPYREFLQRYGTDAHRERWQSAYDRVTLTRPQEALLRGFVRQIHLLCLAGTWCGDCVRDGPILQRIAEASAQVHLRFLDRDENPDLARSLAINNGLRIPMVVSLSEDFFECGRYGERTLATYRKMAADRLGGSRPVEGAPGEEYLRAVTQEWLDQVERVQLLLRLSPRLRERHGD